MATMADERHSAYDAALTELLGRQTTTDKDLIRKLDSVDSFLNHVDDLSGTYSKKQSSVYFQRLRPALDWLWSFNSSVQSYLQASPKAFVLLWGSLSIILQLCQSYSRRIDLLVDSLEAIRDTQPRFDLYGVHLVPLSNGSLQDKLFSYYLELLQFFSSAVKFFQKPFYRNFLHASFRKVQSARIRRLENLSSHIDKEAVAIGIAALVGAQFPDQQHSAKMLLGTRPFSNLPRRNCSFFGRDTETDALQVTLGKASENASIALYGLPGSGKSQLAAEYAHRKHEDNTYEVVLWISAETEVKLAESVGSICQGLGIMESKDQLDRERQKTTLLRWLSKTSKQGQCGTNSLRWLVIFDNVCDSTVVEPYWDVISGGSAIVTCRSPETATHLLRKQLRVGCFDTFSGVGFLLSLIMADENGSEEDTRIATFIADAVGNHPLALNMIGCHVRRCGKSMQHFIRDNPTFERDFLFRRDRKLGAEYITERTVGDVFARSVGEINMLPAQSPARTLLSLLAFLDPDGTPLSVFTGHTVEAMLCDGPDDLEKYYNLPKLLETLFDDSSVFDNARGALLDMSLISMDDHNARIRCHRLVRLAMQREMSSEEISFALHKLLFFLNSAFPAQSDGQPLLSQWAICDEFAGSILYVLESCMRYKDLPGQPILLAEVVCRCSWYYYEHGWFVTATRLADQAIEFCHHALATGNHIGYTTWYVKDMISHQFNTKGAIGMKSPEADHGLGGYGEALRIRLENRREGSAEDEKWIGAAMGNLALSQMAMGRSEQALPKLLELVHRDDMKTNEDLYLSNLCLCYSLLDRFEEALATSRKAEARVESQWGGTDIRMATILYYVANIRLSMGELECAEENLAKCLRIREEKMPSHPETGLTHHRMGVLLNTKNDPLAAVGHFVKAFSILSSCECHPGALCRTALELKALVQRAGNDDLLQNCENVFQASLTRTRSVDIAGLGDDATEYDRFITVGLR